MTPPKNIFELAKKNSKHLTSAFNSIKNPSIEKFAERVKNDGTVSINRKLENLLDTLKNDRILNVYDNIKLENPNITNEEINEKLKERQPKHYKKRITFDAYFDGKDFKYGALNIGNIGAYTDDFGQFCIVLKKENIEGYENLCFIKKNSLEHYVDDDCNIKLTVLKKDISDLKDMHYLAAMKHHTEINDHNESEWSDILCKGEKFIEAIIKDVIFVEHFEEIRIKKDDYNKYNKLAIKLALTKIADPVDKVNAKYFSEIRKHMKDKNLSFNKIN
ncbi:MAG: hypothetical protein HY738_20235 [Bacteroidia bacterium]|nr:hypothetical protein [Bacteroidia bacterium]